MLYAHQDGLRVIVAAASTVSELEKFYATASTAERGEVNRPAPFDMMLDEYLSRFKVPPIIIEYSNDDDVEALIADYGITLVKKNALVDRHADMVEELDKVIDEETLPEGMTIGEFYGLDKDDPWDKRSDEEKAQDEAFKKAYEEAKAAGKLSGDSFAAPKGDNVRVTDINTVTDADGNIVIRDVMAQKGLHADNSEEREAAEAAKAAGLPQPTADTSAPAAAPSKTEVEVEVDSDDLSIDPNGMVAVYHKVEVTGAKLAEVKPVLTAVKIDVDALATVQRNSSTGCWFAFLRLTQAEKVAETLGNAGYEVEVYGVNDLGERLVPKGVQIVDTEAERVDPPRPWNDRAAEIPAMTDEEKAANDKSLDASEFLFTGAYHGAETGCILFVTPKSYFAAHKVMYPEPLDIAALLPPDLKEVSPGVYKTTSRDWINLTQDMARRGFIESILLQLYLNNL